MLFLVDVDDTTCGLFDLVPQIYSAITGENITKASFCYSDWDHSLVVKNPPVLRSLFNPFIYDYCRPIIGAVSGIKQLREAGHKIIFCTVEDKGNAKLNWLRNYLFLEHDQNDLIVSRDKSLIRADIMVDDAIHHLTPFQGEKICYPQPWNVEWKGDRMNWSQIAWRYT